jgi:prepilin-type N-terminal cleavage/methylation domain-containing protein
MARPTLVTNLFASTGNLRRARRGFTLAECLIASVVLAVGVLGISAALTAASSQNQSTDIDARSLAIARAMMEEIAARPFDRDANELGAPPTCIADYDGVQRTTAPLAQPTTAADSLTFTSNVHVQFRATPAGPSDPSGDLALITVVTTPSDKSGSVTLHRMVSRFTRLRN